MLRRHVPNLLSFSRIMLAFAFPFLASEWRLPAILWALLSEFLDGFLARRWNVESDLGQALDPIADKLFVLSVMGTMIHEHRLSWLHFALIAMRDIVVAIGSFSVMYETGGLAIAKLKPRWSGKIATTFQFALLVSLFLSTAVIWPLFVATAVVSCVSGIDYLYAVLHRRFDSLASPER